jgi:hypothetical protein
MNSGVTPDFTLPRFYVANLVEGMRKRLQVWAAFPPSPPPPPLPILV